MESLDILNGDMSPKYDKYNDVYTVNVDSDIDKLIFEYEINDNKILNVYGNLDFELGQNKVVLSIRDNDNIEYITFLVNKQKQKEVSMLEDNVVYLQVENDDYVPSYAPYLITLSCFSIILLIFSLFYLKKRNN